MLTSFSTVFVGFSTNQIAAKLKCSKECSSRHFEFVGFSTNQIAAKLKCSKECSSRNFEFLFRLMEAL